MQLTKYSRISHSDYGYGLIQRIGDTCITAQFATGVKTVPIDELTIEGVPPRVKNSNPAFHAKPLDTSLLRLPENQPFLKHLSDACVINGKWGNRAGTAKRDEFCREYHYLTGHDVDTTYFSYASSSTWSVGLKVTFTYPEACFVHPGFDVKGLKQQAPRPGYAAFFTGNQLIMDMFKHGFRLGWQHFYPLEEDQS